MLYCHGCLWVDSGAVGQAAASIAGSFSVAQCCWIDFCAPVLQLLSAGGKIYFRARKFAEGRPMAPFAPCWNVLAPFEIWTFANGGISAVDFDPHTLWHLSQS
jgi:hypothetical protein